mmetsp:Transcript_34371/g.78327  ORF Transcript_34371/g.78327 Transcript_34371/m.78327 type:complete len:226 (+) Transcript_34371:52-729(+)
MTRTKPGSYLIAFVFASALLWSGERVYEGFTIPPSCRSPRELSLRSVKQECVEDCEVDLLQLDDMPTHYVWEDATDPVMQAWEAHIDRINFEGGVPDASDFRAPSPTPSAYSEESGYREVEVRQAMILLAAGGAELWDVRDSSEFQLGRALHAQHVPFERLEGAAAEHNEARERGETALPVLLICASGSRSAQAQVRLSRVYGVQNVASVKGGLALWEAYGGPLV